jgi:hypothetical protein
VKNGACRNAGDDNALSRELRYSDGDALAVFAAGSDLFVEGEVVADHGDLISGLRGALWLNFALDKGLLHD